MKPNFALILDQDGIVLLHRSKNGWRVIGQANPASPDLSREMEYLRRSATALAGGQFATKLVIPNSQILYQRVTVTGDEGDRSVQVRESLDGLTPYGVDELAFDWYDIEDGGVMVAAVAEQTLHEAEQFADQHRFNPISFVAIPESEEFSREPYFGTTSGARRLLNPGGVVERDIKPVDMQAVLAALENEAQLVPPADDTPIFLVQSISATPSAVPDHEAGETPIAPKTEVHVESEQSDGTEAETEKANDTEPEDVEILVEANAQDPHDEEVPAPADADMAHVEEKESGAAEAPILAFSSRRSTISFEPENAENGPEPGSIAARFSPRDTGETFSRPQDDPKEGAEPEEAEPPKPTAPTVADAVVAIKSRATPVAVGAPHMPPPPKPANIRPAKTFGGMALLLVLAALAAIGLASATAYIFLGAPDNELVGSGLFDNVPAALPDSPAINDTGASGNDLTAQTSPTKPDDTIATQVQTAPNPPETDPNANLDALFGIDAPEVTLSGIRQLAPVSPVAPSSDRIDGLYLASIDRAIIAHDAIALPTIATMSPDGGLVRQAPPPEFGSEFAFDDQGLVAPSPEGTLSPDGILVFLGSPAIVPVPRPGSGEVVEADGLSAERRLALAKFTPVPRPDLLAEVEERSRLAGLSRNELAGIRPVPRPSAAEPQPEPEVVPAEPTERAVLASMIPVARPNGLAETARAAAVQAVRPPPPPAGATVAQAATIQNGLRLNQVNLVGVYGSSSSRRALVRMRGGRFVMVTVGDRLDGGRVAAIATDSLVYTKRGRNITLEVPSG